MLGAGTGEGVTRVVETDDQVSRLRELSDEIARVRLSLTAVVTELDRRRHHATDVQHLAREHAGTVAAVALMLAAVLAMPVVLFKVRRRRQRVRRRLELIDKAHRLGRALGRVAHDPDRLAAPPSPRVLKLPPKQVAALALTTAQIIASLVLEWRRRREPRHMLQEGSRGNQAWR
jgi:hypothetical protein